MVTPDLYKDIVEEKSTELQQFQDLTNLLNLFPSETTEDNLIEDKIFTYLEDVAQASLSDALWNPTKVRHELATFKHHRYSSGIRKDMDYKTWSMLMKMQVHDSNLSQIVAKPGIQGTHYFFQGKKLLDDYSQGDPPISTQYNYVLDVGADTLASTLTRPIPANVASGSPNTFPASAGAWATYANMTTDISTAVSSLESVGFTKYEDYLVFFPRKAAHAFNKKRNTSGDGHRNAYMEFEDMGIGRDQIIQYDDIYAYTRAGAIPTYEAFDMLIMVRSNVRILYTEKPFTNVWVDNDGAKYPEMHIEAGMAYMPFFRPEYNANDKKYYKGVAVVQGINGK